MIQSFKLFLFLTLKQKQKFVVIIIRKRDFLEIQG